ncbi:arylsulfatase [Candidatus Viadribacter manganicus]|uniref:Arylsulfatase n=1 Tax=Candidatus Viadribacter manganicus TaxID=1759059 RepID=A0A1B1ANL7_9PROT|nr:arylsulfatase [Candidatus Viadribacter manganicus]
MVVIIADDAGFTDFGAYGGEAHTPNIDALAQRGAQFSRYYSSPLCSPSRAMLLSGMDNHRTGHATIIEVLAPEMRGRPGYTMRLEPGVVTIAERLRQSGYRTYATGKWHLGHGEGDLPNAHGFDRSFVLDASGADNWEERAYMPYYQTADWFEDGERAHLPENFYSSQFIVDRMIRYLDADSARANEPFFAYLAFQAVHIPVQAPREITAHYRGAYEGGWEQLRANRWRRAQELGLLPTGAAIDAPHPSLRPWASISGDEQALYARSMEVHAGMLEAMDQSIGRFISYLQSRGLAENTIFVVTSDNGPEPSNPIADPDFRRWMSLTGYTRRMEDLGERGSFVMIGPEWANATATGSLYKFTSGEGGLHVPLIIAGPNVIQQRIDARAFVTDIAPTLLERAGAPLNAPAMDGFSMSALLAGETPHGREPLIPLGVEVSGHSALYRGDFKLVRTPPPLGDSSWRLYNITQDPGETTDLAAQMPELLASMLADYQAYAERNGVLELPPGYDPQAQVAHNTRMKIYQHYWYIFAGIGLVGLLLIGGVIWLVMRLFKKRPA